MARGALPLFAVLAVAACGTASCKTARPTVVVPAAVFDACYRAHFEEFPLSFDPNDILGYGFGTSLSDGVDLDFNDVPDVIISAPGRASDTNAVGRGFLYFR